MSVRFGIGAAIAVAVAGVGTASVIAQGCIYHDTDIQFPDPGHKWCAELAGAEEWTILENRFPIFDDGWPEGCVCFVESENELLLEAPGPMDPNFSEYADLVAAIQDAARDRCLAMKDDDPVHPFDNCAALADVAEVYQLDPMGEEDCKTWRTPSDTDGEGYDGYPGDHIECSGNSCSIAEAFWQEIRNDPFQLQQDSTYGELVVNGWKLFDVGSSTVAYHLQLRTNDIITEIDGTPIDSTAALDAAILDVQDNSAWTIKLKRGPFTLTKNYAIAVSFGP